MIADAICDKKECNFVGRESELAQTEPVALCCDGGATSSLSSSSLNCAEVTERIVPIQTAPGSGDRAQKMSRLFVRVQIFRDFLYLEKHLNSCRNDYCKRRETLENDYLVSSRLVSF